MGEYEGDVGELLDISGIDERKYEHDILFWRCDSPMSLWAGRTPVWRRGAVDGACWRES